MFPSSEFPKARWTLTAPESYVLLNLDRTYDPREAIKLALEELVLLDVLRVIIVEGKGLFGMKTKRYILAHGKAGPPQAPSLTSIYDIFDSSPITTVEELAREIRSLSGGAMGFYVERVVMRELIARRLVETEARKFMWVVPFTHYRRTAAGEKARADLEARLLMAERLLEGWADEQPTRALTFLRLASSAILLMPTALPNLEYILEQQTQLDSSNQALTEGGNPANQPGVDLFDIIGGVLRGIDISYHLTPNLNIDPSIFDCLDEIFGAISSGVDIGLKPDTGGD